MAYLLEIYQGDKRYFVGTFKEESSIYKFMMSIPFVKKEVFQVEDFIQIDYIMPFEAIPEYYEVSYNNYVYIISKFSFVPGEGEIFFRWDWIHEWDDSSTSEKKVIKGSTLVDSAYVQNDEVKGYITLREQLFSATQTYYNAKGVEIRRCGTGSEDGEYVTLITKEEEYLILYLLDFAAVEIWQETGDFEMFLRKYQEYIGS